MSENEKTPSKDQLELLDIASTVAEALYGGEAVVDQSARQYVQALIFRMQSAEREVENLRGRFAEIKKMCDFAGISYENGDAFRAYDTSTLSPCDEEQRVNSMSALVKVLKKNVADARLENENLRTNLSFGSRLSENASRSTRRLSDSY